MRWGTQKKKHTTKMYQPRVEIPKKKIQSKVELQERINNRERERERENNHIF